MLLLTCRPGYIDTISQSLAAQTLDKSDWELVLVDELFHLRRDIVSSTMQFNVKHVPQEPSPVLQGTKAHNLGIKHCDGELIYFMCDYNFPHPRCLERHWEIYQRYGPKVFISGPLIDGITFSGGSVWMGAQPVMLELMLVSEGRTIVCPENIPPILLGIKDNCERPISENLVSIFKSPFIPVWGRFGTDWRVGQICDVSVEKNLYECNKGPQWWWTRNDSAPRIDLDGMPEVNTRSVGNTGCDTMMISKLVDKGYRYLVDREAPSYVLPHPWRKTLA